MNSYKHLYKADGSFDIKEYRSDARVRFVGSDNSGYVEFVKTYTPEEVEYIAPENPTEAQILEAEIATLEMELLAMDAKLSRAEEDTVETLISKSICFTTDFPEALIQRKNDKEAKRAELIAKIAERV